MSRLRRPHHQLLLILAVALCLRALVPSGFMPGQGALLELCTLDGIRTVLVDSQTGELLDADPDPDHPECPWVAVFANAILADSHQPLASIAPAGPAIAGPASVWPAPTLKAPQARAPPPFLSCRPT